MAFHWLLYGQFTNSKWWSEWATEMDAANDFFFFFKVSISYNDDPGRKISDYLLAYPKLKCLELSLEGLVD